MLSGEEQFQTAAIKIGRGDDTVGNPNRAQISQFELFEPILLLKLDRQFPVEQFEATASQSTVPSPPLLFIDEHKPDQTNPIWPTPRGRFPVGG